MESLDNANEVSRDTGNVDVISILDATIERIFTNENSRYITISYITADQYSMIHKNFITLVVGPDTLILNPFGESVSFDSLRPKLFVDVDLSAAMTFSIPPQAKAFRIIVNYKNWPFNARIARVLRVDVDNKFLYTGNADNIYSQVRFVINDSTQILDSAGKKIKLEDLKPGQFVRLAYATFMTASIPPQTTAFRVQTL